MRTKYSYRTASREVYNRFKIAYPDLNISYAEFCSIIYKYMENFREYLLETGDMGKLPRGFGYFGINKKKRKRYKGIVINGVEKLNLSIDWKATREEGKTVYNFNFHTDGYTYWWRWYKNTAYLGLLSCIYFKPSRDTSRLLAKYLKKPDSEYYQIYREDKSRSVINLYNE